MKSPLFFLAILLTGIIACKKEVTPEPTPVTPTAPAIIYADSVAGTYTGINVRWQHSLTPAINDYDTTSATVIVTIDSTTSYQITINADTFALDSVNHFRTIHPSVDPHVFNEGEFTLDGSGGATLVWRKGSHYMSSALINTFSGSR